MKQALKYQNISVSEIKLLFFALTGCTSLKTVPPESAPCTLPIYSNNIKIAQKTCTHRVHTPEKRPRCTLNFGELHILPYKHIQMLSGNLGVGIIFYNDR